MMEEKSLTDRSINTCMHSRPVKLTSVMAFRAVSEPMLRSDPGMLLETVAGIITIGTQNSAYLSRADESSSNPTYACSMETQHLIGKFMRLIVEMSDLKPRYSQSRMGVMT